MPMAPYDNSRPKRFWRKVSEQFTRNVGGQIISGDPKHPEKMGRFVEVTEEQAAILVDAGLIGKTNVASPADDEGEVDIVEGEGEGEGGGDTGTGSTENRDGTTPIDGRSTAQGVREKRAAGKPAGVQQQRKGRAKRTDATDAPAGGRSTTATTNHPANSSPFTDGENAGSGGSEGDEAPTGGGGS